MSYLMQINSDMSELMELISDAQPQGQKSQSTKLQYEHVNCKQPSSADTHTDTERENGEHNGALEGFLCIMT